MSNPRDEAKIYLAKHGIPQLFECLLSSLMLERPSDPVKFIEQKIAEVKLTGAKNINWETFVFHLHPFNERYKRKSVKDRRSLNQRSKISTTEMSSTSYKSNMFELTESNTN